MTKKRPVSKHRHSFAIVAALTLAFVGANFSKPRAEQAQPQTGVSAACVDHFTAINLAISLATPIVGITQIITDILADEGWVWIEPNGRRIRSVSGQVHNVHVANNDLFANHDSHDVDFELRVDPGQEDMLSPVSGDADEDPRAPDSIGIEWESGIRPDEKTGDGANPTFPKWAWRRTAIARGWTATGFTTARTSRTAFITRRFTRRARSRRCATCRRRCRSRARHRSR